ncbi:hypothetical protein [Streptomyces sp. NBC_01803]|uniref:hypothetical protein n=1 Tax=Streptomyces sp. NBC_01803 TaxID=2975946 RepID=UPI002DD82031|nr:hypothetical protein [Streptomyces sp. NBC_01803]WSA44659.1 hypothetical protein OIE51_10845 [Streptomyces sp. NBC_01803]
MAGRPSVRWLRAHLGRRGGFLFIVGAGELLWGLQFMLDPAPNARGLALLTDAAPLHAWSWLWVAAGAAAVLSSLVKAGRDWAGFAAALAPPIVWLGAYLTAAVSGDYSRGLWVAGYYATIHVGVLLWASATPEFPVPQHKGGER